MCYYEWQTTPLPPATPPSPIPSPPPFFSLALTQFLRPVASCLCKHCLLWKFTYFAIHRFANHSFEIHCFAIQCFFAIHYLEIHCFAIYYLCFEIHCSIDFLFFFLPPFLFLIVAFQLVFVWNSSGAEDRQMARSGLAVSRGAARGPSALAWHGGGGVQRVLQPKTGAWFS